MVLLRLILTGDSVCGYAHRPQAARLAEPRRSLWASGHFYVLNRTGPGLARFVMPILHGVECKSHLPRMKYVELIPWSQLNNQRVLEEHAFKVLGRRVRSWHEPAPNPLSVISNDTDGEEAFPKVL